MRANWAPKNNRSKPLKAGGDSPLVPQMTNKEGAALTFSRSSPPRCTLGFYSDAPTKAVDC